MVDEKQLKFPFQKLIFPLAFLVLSATVYLKSSAEPMATSKDVPRDGHLVTCDFEVFGVVQGKNTRFQ